LKKQNQEIKPDSNNYRIHSDKNKKIIEKSLKEFGAGRSIVIDSNNEIIAGNGVYEAAKKQNIKTRIIETNGTELLVVKRTDLKPGDEKRKQLALIDNHSSDTSAFDFELVNKDFNSEFLNNWDFDIEQKIPKEIESIAISRPFESNQLLITYPLRLHSLIKSTIDNIKDIEGVEISYTGK
jgi:hypothetical protein